MRRIVAVGVLLVAGMAGVRAQDPATALVAAQLSQAWQALATGRMDEAVRLADAVLSASPRDHHAIGVKVEALVAAGRPTPALDAYENWLRASGREDPLLIEPIAIATLRAIVATGEAGTLEPRLRFEALERLVRAGDAGAASLLKSATEPEAQGGQAVWADLVRARLGDADAAGRLAGLLQSPQVRDKSALLEVVGQSGARETVPSIVPLLNDPAPPTRAAAAQALGALSGTDAIPALQRALQDPVALVRYAAAVALAKLGDTTADPLLEHMLSSNVPDVRLLAAEAYAARGDSRYVPAVSSILNDSNPLNRIRAAQLLAPTDASAGARVMTEALGDANPVVREQAARVVERVPGVFPDELAVLRGLLRDANPWVRLHAASAILFHRFH